MTFTGRATACPGQHWSALVSDVQAYRDLQPADSPDSLGDCNQLAVGGIY